MKNEFLMASLLCFAGFWGCSQNDTQASSGSTWDETETTALTGRVQDSLGNPLAAARVRLVGSASDSARETISDADGAFSFAGAASGNNYIEVTYRNSLGILRKISVDSSTAPKHALNVNVVAHPLARFSGCLADSLVPSAKILFIREIRKFISVTNGCWASTLLPAGVYTFYAADAAGDTLANLSSSVSGVDSLAAGFSVVVSNQGTAQKDSTLSLTLAIPSDSLNKFMTKVDTAWYELTAKSMDTVRVAYLPAVDSLTAPAVILPSDDSIRIVLYAYDSTGALVYRSTAELGPSSGEKTLEMTLESASLAIVPTAEESNDTYIVFGFDSTTAVLKQASYSAVSAGQKTILNAGIYDWSTILRVLMNFSMTRVDTSYPVRKARLRLYIAQWNGDKGTVSAFRYGVHAVLKSWQEGYSLGDTDLVSSDLTADSTSVSAMYRVSGTAWDSIGLALNDDDATKAALDTGSIALGTIGVVYLDVTNFVKYQVKNPDKAYGLLLRNLDEFLKPADYPQFYSAEGAAAAKAAGTFTDDSAYPALIIEY